MSLVKRSGLLLFWLLVSVQAVGLDVTNRGTVEAFIDGAVKPLMQNKHGPAGVVLVMKDGKVILNKGYGYQTWRDGFPLMPTTRCFVPARSPSFSPGLLFYRWKNRASSTSIPTLTNT